MVELLELGFGARVVETVKAVMKLAALLYAPRFIQLKCDQIKRDSVNLNKFWTVCVLQPPLQKADSILNSKMYPQRDLSKLNSPDGFLFKNTRKERQVKSIRQKITNRNNF